HFEHCDTVEYGHHDVEQDEIKRVLPQQVQGLLAARRSGGRIAMMCEAAAQQIAVIFVVIHDQEHTQSRYHREALLSVKTLPFTVCSPLVSACTSRLRDSLSRLRYRGTYRRARVGTLVGARCVPMQYQVRRYHSRYGESGKPIQCSETEGKGV